MIKRRKLLADWRRSGSRVFLAVAFATALGLTMHTRGFAQGEPKLVSDVVEFSRLIPLIPEPPASWSAEKAEGSTSDAGGVNLTTVHRDYTKGTAENAPVTSISILDTASSPELAQASTAGWNVTNTSTEGYTKPVTINGNPGFEAFENEGKHGTLWLMIAQRYLLQIETREQDSKDLQEWLKRIDLKKLAEVK